MVDEGPADSGGVAVLARSGLVVDNGSIGHDAADRGTVVGRDHAHDTNRHTGDKQREHKTADRAKGSAGIIGKSPSREEDVGPTCTSGHHASARVSKPRTGGDEADHHEEEPDEVRVNQDLAVRVPDDSEQGERSRFVSRLLLDR